MVSDLARVLCAVTRYDTFQSVARACLAEGKDQMSREVIAKRKKFHNRVKEDTPTAPELNNLF